MHAPWWIYLIAILVALPCYILWAVGGWGLLKMLVSWVVADQPARPPVKQMSARG